MTQPPPYPPSTFTDDDRKYLEMLQSVITRLANNSFLLKGWAITLIVAIVSLDKGGFDWYETPLIIPILLFMLLDAYFLNLEKGYRDNFEKARNHLYPLYSFKLDPSNIKKYPKTVFSRSILPFYLALIIFAAIALSIPK